MIIKLLVCYIINDQYQKKKKPIKTNYIIKYILQQPHSCKQKLFSFLFSPQGESSKQVRDVPILGLSIPTNDQSKYRTKPILIPYKPLDNTFASLSAKIKAVLRPEQQKENMSYFKSGGGSVMQKSKLCLVRKSNIYTKQQVYKPVQQAPYFLQCLARKSSVTYQIYSHINHSILTFKQFLKTVQFTRPKDTDPRVPLQNQNKKTVVFDMDETLIHTNQFMVKGYQLKVPFKSIHGKTISGYVHVRPYAKEIIKNISRYFDVVIFTAGNQCYADPILDYLDPDNCIKHRLYRQSCTCINNQILVKDLRVLGRKLQNIVLVDNAPHSYMMQLFNGIPILNYLKGNQDDQLVQLQKYLMGLKDVSDVRVVNAETFKMHEYLKYQNYHSLIKELYSKWI